VTICRHFDRPTLLDRPATNRHTSAACIDVKIASTMSGTSLTLQERQGAAAALAVALKYYEPTRTGLQTLLAIDVFEGLGSIINQQTNCNWQDLGSCKA
tara:strand:+ start:77 stop:373 length:297 start_codon:yes stop_codon:yes gene_type:complete